MEAIHVVNAVLWQPGEQAQNTQQHTDKQTTTTTRGCPRASGLTRAVLNLRLAVQVYV